MPFMKYYQKQLCVSIRLNEIGAYVCNIYKSAFLNNTLHTSKYYFYIIQIASEITLCISSDNVFSNFYMLERSPLPIPK